MGADVRVCGDLDVGGHELSLADAAEQLAGDCDAAGERVLQDGAQLRDVAAAQAHEGGVRGVEEAVEGLGVGRGFC